MEIYNADMRRLKGRLIRFTDLANHLGLHRNTIYNWFNQGEMDHTQKQEIKGAILEIKANRRNAMETEKMDVI